MFITIYIFTSGKGLAKSNSHYSHVQLKNGNDQYYNKKAIELWNSYSKIDIISKSDANLNHESNSNSE